MAGLAGTIAWFVQADRRRTVLDNLARTAPNETPARRNLLGRRTFRNMAMAVTDLVRLSTASRDEVLSLVEVRGLEHLDAARAMEKGVIVVTAHLGPYELGGAWAAALGYPVHAMVEDLDPDVMTALASYRQATGMRLISMKQGLRGVFRLLEERQMVLLVADRAIGESRGAVELPFGDGIRLVPTGPATFAVASGAPIVVGHIALNPARRPRYLVHFEPPLIPAARPDVKGPARSAGDEEERLRLTRRITELLSAAVRRHPDEWYVFQPRWVSSDRD
jgi:KDO2-lipid IV(A) lauroyltransferase